MKRFEIKNINTPSYWDKAQTAFDFGLRQQKYSDLAGKGDKIVEIGCGLSPFLSKAHFKERWGLDFSPKTVEKARKLYKGVNYFECEATQTPFKDDYFDVAVAGELIEHLENPEDLIKEMFRIAKKVIISTPHLEFLDKEHLVEFSEWDFVQMGFDVETIHSERFPGRSYIFAWKTK